MNQLNKISEYIKITNCIDENTKYTHTREYPERLLNSNRIDLISKLKYIDMKFKNLNYNFPLDLYREHLVAFSGSQNIVEPGNEIKNCLDAYLDDFNKLINDIRSSGFNSDISMVPVGNKNTIFDGAHRVSTALYFNKEIDLINFELPAGKFDLAFFEERGLAKIYLDYLALEYTKIKENLFMFFIWPISDSSKINEAEEIIRNNFEVVYKKSVDLSYNGYRNLIIHAYQGFCDEWLGSYQNHYPGALSKVNEIYNKNRLLNVFLVEADNVKKVLDIKEKVRNIFKIDKHSIHATDNITETRKMASILFNENSIYLLNNGNPDKFEKINSYIAKLNFLFDENKLNRDDFVIVASSVMSLFAIRETADLDYISKYDLDNLLKDYGFDNHEQYLNLYGYTKDEILYDPNNYLVYMGFKFITLDVLKKMKRTRSEQKDIVDIRMIESFQNGSRFSFYVFIKNALPHLKKILMFPVRLLKSILRKISFLERNYRILRLYLLYLKKKPKKVPTVIDSLNTIDTIINNRNSIVRFGDGEFDIINGKGIKFQSYDELLSKRLLEVLNSESNVIMTGIPNIYSWKSYRYLVYDTKVFWLEYLVYDKILELPINCNKVYYDAFISRFYFRYKNKKYSSKIIEKLKSIWDNRDIVIIEGKHSRLGYSNDLFQNANSVKRILCPNKNAYSKYDEILEVAKTIDKNSLVILGLGPTATVMAYDLAEYGLQAIDLGHIDIEYEWFKAGAKEKIAIKNKETSEAVKENTVVEIDDPVYKAQILAEIE